MTTARDPLSTATADELAEAIVLARLEIDDEIRVRYDSKLLAPYGIDPDNRCIVLPERLTWPQKQARIYRCWLWFIGGARLAPEFADLDDHPNRRGRSATAPPHLRSVR